MLKKKRNCTFSGLLQLGEELSDRPRPAVDALRRSGRPGPGRGRRPRMLSGQDGQQGRDDGKRNEV